MALEKEIKLDNGIIVNYHRIVSINKITNNSTVLEIASYTDKSKREKEKESLENNTSMNIFINTIYLSKEYDENEIIKDSYEYLKNTETFSNSKDI